MAEHDPDQNKHENRPGMDKDNENDNGTDLDYSEIN